MTSEDPSRRLVLLTGATGYVGGRLLERLLSTGADVRCLARRPENLRSRTGPDVDIFPGDVLDRNSLDKALEGPAHGLEEPPPSAR